MGAPSRTPRSAPRARRAALPACASLIATLAAAATAVAAPTITGDTDVWNLAKPVPSYEFATAAADPRINWSIDGAPSATSPQTAPFTATFPGLADGSHSLSASDADAVDPAVVTRAFLVDLTPPKITITKPTKDAQFTVGEQTLAEFTCEFACTGTVGGVAVASGGALDTSKAGSFRLRVESTDDHGNQAVSLADFVVKASPPPAGQIATTPSEPISLVQTPSTPTPSGARRPPYRPRTVNAKSLRPAVGLRLPTRTPLLRWGGRKDAVLYNVQIYWLRGTSATKVASLFPRTHNLRVPRGRVAFGHTYIWRVWPYLRSGRYASRPLGLSYFTVKKNPAR